MMKRRLVFSAPLVILLALLAGCTGLITDPVTGRTDVGLQLQAWLKQHSLPLFGVTTPLSASAPAQPIPYRTPAQTAAEQLLLAEGLQVRYLTREAAEMTDMMVLWPDDRRPTHIITCVEGQREWLAANKLNPSVQRIDLQHRSVTTVLRGMTACDGIRVTPWGTVLVTEETVDGGAYEILDPLNVTEQHILDRATGVTSAPQHIVKRSALPTMEWEGIVMLPNGVVIGGDEFRPGTQQLDQDGGAIFRFVPKRLRTDRQPIIHLDQSPLTDGNVYALAVSCVEPRQTTFPQYGQGCEVGNAVWVKVSASHARAEAHQRGATGFYRPEDMHDDPAYRGPGIRYCWTNTGQVAAQHFGEVICAVEQDIAAQSERVDARTGYRYLSTAEGRYAQVFLQRFIEGDPDFNAFDNLAFQPGTGNLYVLEDHPNGDVWACLPDDADRDLKSDGCIKVMSVRDPSAEPTGLIFTADGGTAFLSIQHSDDRLMPLIDGYRTDDILVITGFRVPQSSKP